MSYPPPNPDHFVGDWKNRVYVDEFGLILEHKRLAQKRPKAKNTDFACFLANWSDEVRAALLGG